MDHRITDFDISVDQNRIVLRGDLDGSPRMLKVYGQVLRQMPRFSRFTVEAQDARITPEGVAAWIEGVREFLMGCEMVYAPSQLGMILQYDGRYDHPASSYQEYVSSYPEQQESVVAFGEGSY